MSSLLLSSIEIKNFRAFSSLHIEKLGNVNLIVGKNSVGKSSLLEAIQVYACRNHSILWEIATQREEGSYPTIDENTKQEQRLKALKYLFHGRGELSEYSSKLRIGEFGDRNKQVLIEFSWRTDDEPEIVRPTLKIRASNNIPTIDYFMTNGPLPSDLENISCTKVPSDGLSKKDVELLWSRIALTEEENSVLQALRIILPHIERVGIISNPELDMVRTAIAKTKNSKEPISLQSMGDGVNRIFNITLALVNSKNGFLLIDEIGSGLHYSIQLELWNLIFSMAENLNVQVFATTHSNDTIQSFQIASEESKKNGMLIRLEKRNDKIVPILFDEKRLAIATSQEIEVR